MVDSKSPSALEKKSEWQIPVGKLIDMEATGGKGGVGIILKVMACWHLCSLVAPTYSHL